MLVSSKDNTERVIMRENKSRFKLACASQHLDRELLEGLWILGNDSLAWRRLNNGDYLESFPGSIRVTQTAIKAKER